VFCAVLEAIAGLVVWVKQDSDSASKKPEAMIVSESAI
jgi:hypothetical protein